MDGAAVTGQRDEPRLTVVKVSYHIMTAVDDDGTPLHHGERMVEIEPGVWADPVVAAAMDFLEAALDE